QARRAGAAPTASRAGGPARRPLLTAAVTLAACLLGVAIWGGHSFYGSATAPSGFSPAFETLTSPKAEALPNVPLFRAVPAEGVGPEAIAALAEGLGMALGPGGADGDVVTLVPPEGADLAALETALAASPELAGVVLRRP
ncbi:MAG: hypothetical protein ACFBRM_14305, partial [Pikeienuella sp.]